MLDANVIIAVDVNQHVHQTRKSGVALGVGKDLADVTDHRGVLFVCWFGRGSPGDGYSGRSYGAGRECQPPRVLV